MLKLKVTHRVNKLTGNIMQRLVYFLILIFSVHCAAMENIDESILATFENEIHLKPSHSTNTLFNKELMSDDDYTHPLTTKDDIEESSYYLIDFLNQPVTTVAKIPAQAFNYALWLLNYGFSIYSDYSAVFQLANFAKEKISQVNNGTYNTTFSLKSQESENGTLLNCFFHHRLKNCSYSAYTNALVTSVLTITNLAINYIIYRHRGINRPSPWLVGAGIASMSAMTAWLEFSPTIFMSIQLLKVIFLATNQYDILLRLSRPSYMVYSSIHFTGAIQYAVSLYDSGYISYAYNTDTARLLLSLTISSSVIVNYINNIATSEQLLIFTGFGFQHYLLSAFAALYGTQNDQPFLHHHVVAIYGATLFNSVFPIAGIPNPLSFITFMSIFILRYAHHTMRYLPDVVEGFNPIEYLIHSIAIPSVQLLNMRLH